MSLAIRYSSIVFLASLLGAGILWAQSGSGLTDGLWWSPEKDAKLNFYKAKNGKYYGKIAWMKDNKTETDVKNPDPEKRDRPLMGMVIFSGFEKDGSSDWINGKIYDAKTGKTYSGKMHLKNANTLELRGYIGFSLLGRTETLTKVK